MPAKSSNPNSPATPSRAGVRPTMATIAAELNVSVMTVSNAYNRPDQLSATLRERILRTAAELGYAGPDALGRGLRRGSAGALGVLYDTWPSYVFEDPSAIAFLRGLTETTARAFMGVLLLARTWPELDRRLDTAAADGFVAYSLTDDSPQLREAISRRPTVIVDQPLIESVPRVGIDDEAAAAQAADHLVQLGHTRIGVLAFALALDGREGPAGARRRGSATFAVSRARLDGYRTALTAAGIDWDGVPIYECGFPPRMPIAVAHLLERRPRPTALLAMSDTLALTALRVAAEYGLRVPEDLSIVGFDDAPMAGQVTPPLTTVRQPHADKGRRAGEMLLALVSGEGSIQPSLILPAELIVRASTGPPASR
jgi:DNA-binding LacI/PurR family transcriptional regulator